MSLMIPERVQSRAMTHIVVVGDCVETTYSSGNHGYGQIVWLGEDGRYHGTTVHRAAWVGYTGEQIPDEMTVDHTCRNPRCVRRVHLRLMSNYDNGRMNGAAGHYDPEQSCHRGHDAARRHARKNGHTVCEDCVELSRQKYKASHA